MMCINEIDKEIIRALQEDLPICPEPFKEIAENLGISEDVLLERIHFFLDSGIMRRFGAALRHHQLGFKSNAMVVWKIPATYSNQAGHRMAQFSEVSHCYERPTYPDWPYNLFTMIHAASKDECFEIAKKIALAVGFFDYELLFSSHELKKISMRYFYN